VSADSIREKGVSKHRFADDPFPDVGGMSGIRKKSECAQEEWHGWVVNQYQEGLRASGETGGN